MTQERNAFQVERTLKVDVELDYWSMPLGGLRRQYEDPDRVIVVYSVTPSCSFLFSI
jgi:hypothetical protein